VLSLERGDVLGPELSHQLDLLTDDVAEHFARVPVVLELLAVPAVAHTENEPAT